MSHAATMNPSTTSDRGAPSAAPRAASRRMLWTGRVLGSLATLFLAVDALAKFLKPEPVVKGTLELGYPESVIIPLGVVLLGSTVLYALPRTAFVGAILLTGYLGGAVATHVRVGHPLATHTLFPVYLGVLLWAALALRDARLRDLLLRRPWGPARGAGAAR